jgi:hypothetical protein
VQSNVGSLESVQEKEDNSRPSDLEKSAGGLICKSFIIETSTKLCVIERKEKVEAPKSRSGTTL